MAKLNEPFIPIAPVTPRSPNGIAHATSTTGGTSNQAARAAVKGSKPAANGTWVKWVADWKAAKRAGTTLPAPFSGGLDYK